MVRLGEYNFSIFNMSFRYFNSTMVRLGAETPDKALLFHYEFQFHYGAIGSPAPCCILLNLAHFNSTMVRLGAATGGFGNYAYQISIPLWCDWEYF